MVRRTLRVLASDPLEGCEIAHASSADDLPLVRADAEQLRQVLMNLVRNAVQAMNGSGIVSVTHAAHGWAATRAGSRLRTPLRTGSR